MTGAPNSGGRGGVATPLNFELGGGGVEYLSTPPDFESIFKKNFSHMLLCTGYFYWGGGGGGGLAPLKLI